MLIKFNTAVSGHGVNVQPGVPIEWPDDEAKRYIERGMAEPAKPEVESAVPDAKSEKAVKKLPSRKSRQAE
jgi:hypothetical protein